jgi:DNA-directed RNA polymerase specialized sigma24 family protein
MGYGVDRKSSVKSELRALLPRLKGFANALTGNGQATHSLLKATCKYIVAKAEKEQGHTPFAIWAFTQMHTLWSRREAHRENPREPHSADPRLFLGRGADESASVAFAKFVAQLPPQQRGTLLLVYGEGWSYDETADVFGVPVATVMTRLARSHASLAQTLGEQPGHDYSERPAVAQAPAAQVAISQAVASNVVDARSAGGALRYARA